MYMSSSELIGITSKLEDLATDISKEMMELRDKRNVLETIKTILFECNKNIVNITRFNEDDMNDIIDIVFPSENESSKYKEMLSRSVYMLMNADVFEGTHISQYVNAKVDIRNMLNCFEEYIKKEEQKNIKRTSQVSSYYNEVTGVISKIRNNEQISVESLMYVIREIELSEKEETDLLFRLYKHNVHGYEKSLSSAVDIEKKEEFVEPVKSSEEIVEEFAKVELIPTIKGNIVDETMDADPEKAILKDFVEIGDDKEEISSEEDLIDDFQNISQQANEDAEVASLDSETLEVIKKFYDKYSYMLEQYTSEYGDIDNTSYTTLESKKERYSYLQGTNKLVYMLCDIKVLLDELESFKGEYSSLDNDVIKQLFDEEMASIINQADEIRKMFYAELETKYNKKEAPAEEIEEKCHIFYLLKPNGETYVESDIKSIPVEYSVNIAKIFENVSKPVKSSEIRNDMLKKDSFLSIYGDVALCYEVLAGNNILAIMIETKNDEARHLKNRMDNNREVIRSWKNLSEAQLNEIVADNDQITENILNALNPQEKRGM